MLWMLLTTDGLREQGIERARERRRRHEEK